MQRPRVGKYLPISTSVQQGPRFMTRKLLSAPYFSILPFLYPSGVFFDLFFSPADVVNSSFSYLLANVRPNWKIIFNGSVVNVEIFNTIRLMHFLLTKNSLANCSWTLVFFPYSFTVSFLQLLRLNETICYLYKGVN